MVGSRGGIVRAERLSPERRSEIAREAAQARWDRILHFRSPLVAAVGDEMCALIKRYGGVPESLVEGGDVGILIAEAIQGVSDQSISAWRVEVITQRDAAFQERDRALAELADLRARLLAISVQQISG